VDIPVDNDAAFRKIPEKPTKGAAMHRNGNLEFLMDKFTRGFDPSTFKTELMAEIPELTRNALPGSYEHFFVIILENYDNMEKAQQELQEWLCKRYPKATITPYIATNKMEEGYFLDELEMLRKLLEPLRGNQRKPIFWINSRHMHCDRVCEQLEASVTVIEEFKRDVLAALEKDREDKTCYTALPVSNPRTSIVSMKEIRIEACRATLNWDGFVQAEIELSRFYQYYKNDVIQNRPTKAREEGWLPPFATEVPRSSSEMAREGDLVVWPAHGNNKKLFNLLLKTAMWLSVARGLAAVHLFCDIARHFTAREPSGVASEDYIRFLSYLVHVRATDRVNSNLSTPFPYNDKTLTGGNPDYFDDVWRTNRTLTAKLTDHPSLLEKKNPAPPFILSR
ncbi:hypothetical protein P170DRAFT_318839, partial [Aspergillus steynii IBT 23096]